MLFFFGLLYCLPLFSLLSSRYLFFISLLNVFPLVAGRVRGRGGRGQSRGGRGGRVYNGGRGDYGNGRQFNGYNDNHQYQHHFNGYSRNYQLHNNEGLENGTAVQEKGHNVYVNRNENGNNNGRRGYGRPRGEFRDGERPRFGGQYGGSNGGNDRRKQLEKHKKEEQYVDNANTNNGHGASGRYNLFSLYT